VPHPRRHRPIRDCSGQASAELVALLPVLIVCSLAALQLALCGWALWSAGTAARAGARAERVGGDGASVARNALPGPLRDGSQIDAGSIVKARVRVPALIPGLPVFRVAASTSLGGDGG